jgi:uncharacterized membrane protein YfcA
MDADFEFLVLVVGGLVAGFMDSIAGGGGLITLPILSLVLEPGAHAIGTNKIVGTTGALIALIVYARRSKLKWREGLRFVLSVGVGSSMGAQLTPILPAEFFRWFLIFIAPVVLYFVWGKDRWVHTESATQAPTQGWKLLLVGLACGFYDGAFGPGGGTFMLLGLLVVVRLPLMDALAVSKLANTLSAGVSWATYGSKGYVHLPEGFTMAIGMGVGAWIGSQLASRRAAQIVRPTMLVAVSLLILKLIWDSLGR